MENILDVFVDFDENTTTNGRAQKKKRKKKTQQPKQNIMLIQFNPINLLVDEGQWEMAERRIPSKIGSQCIKYGWKMNGIILKEFEDRLQTFFRE